MQFLSPGWIVTNNNRQRPCINEVLGSIDVVSHGQFGNWCIQHICEHGAAPDKTRAIEHVLRYATEYSTDQFASKVVEKCLKVSGTEFLDRYLEKVCEGRADRPRMPLIDIAGDQVCFALYHTAFTTLTSCTVRQLPCPVHPHQCRSGAS